MTTDTDTNAPTDTRTDADLIGRWPDEYERFQDEALERGGVRDPKAWAIGKIKRLHPWGQGVRAAPERQVLKAKCDACERPGIYLDNMTLRDGFAICARCYDKLGPLDSRYEYTEPRSRSARLLVAFESETEAS